MINAVLIEDELLSLQLLQKKLKQLGPFEIVGSYTNPNDFLRHALSNNFDVAFLDINLGEMDGIELGHKIKQLNPSCHIVFITAHKHFAVDAFELDSVDYIVKPILNKRLLVTIDRIKERLNYKETDTDNLIKITCFADFNVQYENNFIQWKSAKVKELFAFFITHYDEPIHRDIIIDKLWGEHDYQKAKIHLHTCISHIRKLFKHINNNCLNITYANQSYRLHIEHFICDAIQFKEWVKGNDVVTTENLEKTEEIVHQYKGAYLGINGYDWAKTVKSYYEDQLLQLLKQLTEYFHTKQNFEKELYYLQLMFQHDPYTEEVVYKIMQSYLNLGNRCAAIKAYEEYASLLLNDLNITPTDHLKQLYLTIQKG